MAHTQLDGRLQDEETVTNELITGWKATSNVVAKVHIDALTDEVLLLLHTFDDLHVTRSGGVVGLGAPAWDTLQAALLALHDQCPVAEVVVLGEDLHLADCTAALANPAGPFLPGPTAPSAPSAFRTSMAQYYSGPAVTFRPIPKSVRVAEAEAEAAMTVELVDNWKPESKLAAKVRVCQALASIPSCERVHLVDQHPPFVGVGAATWADLRQCLLTLHAVSPMEHVVVYGEDTEFGACMAEVTAPDSQFVWLDPEPPTACDKFETAMAEYYPANCLSLHVLERSSGLVPHDHRSERHASSRVHFKAGSSDQVELTVKQCGDTEGVGEMEVEVALHLQQVLKAMADLMKELKSEKELTAEQQSTIARLEGLIGEQTEEFTRLTTLRLGLERELARLKEELLQAQAARDKDAAAHREIVIRLESEKVALGRQLDASKAALAERDRELQQSVDALAAERDARRALEFELTETRSHRDSFKVTIDSLRLEAEQHDLERTDLRKKVETLRELIDGKERRIASLSEMLDHQQEASSQWAKDRSGLEVELLAQRRQLQSDFDTERLDLQKELLGLRSRIAGLEGELQDVRQAGARQLQEAESRFAAAEGRIGEMEFHFETERAAFQEEILNLKGRMSTTVMEYKETVTEKIYLQEQSKEAEVRLAMSHRRVSELEGRIVLLEAEIRQLTTRLQVKPSVSASMTRKETYKVQSFEVAAMLDAMDGSADGLYLGLPIEVEGEGLYKDLKATGRRSRPGPLSQHLPPLSPARSATPTSEQPVGPTFKVNTLETAARLAKGQGAEAGMYNGLPIEVVGMGLYRDLLRAGAAPGASPASGPASPASGSTGLSPSSGL